MHGTVAFLSRTQDALGLDGCCPNALGFSIDAASLSMASQLFHAGTVASSWSGWHNRAACMPHIMHEFLHAGNAAAAAAVRRRRCSPKRSSVCSLLILMPLTNQQQTIPTQQLLGGKAPRTCVFCCLFQSPAPCRAAITTTTVPGLRLAFDTHCTRAPESLHVVGMQRRLRLAAAQA